MDIGDQDIDSLRFRRDTPPPRKIINRDRL